MEEGAWRQNNSSMKLQLLHEVSRTWPQVVSLPFQTAPSHYPPPYFCLDFSVRLKSFSGKDLYLLKFIFQDITYSITVCPSTENRARQRYLTVWVEIMILWESKIMLVCLLKSLFVLCVCFFLAHVYCIMCVQCLMRPEEASDSPRPDLQTVVRHHMGPGNITWVLWKSSSCSFQPHSVSFVIVTLQKVSRWISILEFKGLNWSTSSVIY